MDKQLKVKLKNKRKQFCEKLIELINSTTSEQWNKVLTRCCMPTHNIDIYIHDEPREPIHVTIFLDDKVVVMTKKQTRHIMRALYKKRQRLQADRNAARVKRMMDSMDKVITKNE